MTIFDVLRALVRGRGSELNDVEWAAKALEAIDQHEGAASPPAPAQQPQEGL